MTPADLTTLAGDAITAAVSLSPLLVVIFAGVLVHEARKRHRGRKRPAPLPRRVPWPPKAVKLSNRELRAWIRFLASWENEAEEPGYSEERKP